LSRDSHLDKVPGFAEFHLLKGPEAEDHTLYASHTVWKNRATFEAWTRSEAFRASHHKLAITSRSILGTRSSRDSRPFRRRGAPSRRSRDTHDRLVATATAVPWSQIGVDLKSPRRP
jgi:hypothetical protein